jgi:hypothetical protein
MRLWGIHPEYLDRAGLVALWRESLLAQKVLRGETKGYRNHPHPQRAIAHYLMGVWEEGVWRGHHFNKAKIGEEGSIRIKKILLTKDQLRYELDWLCIKVQRCDPPRYQRLLAVQAIECYPSFEVVEGAIEEWEKMTTSYR